MLSSIQTVCVCSRNRIEIHIMLRLARRWCLVLVCCSSQNRHKSVYFTCMLNIWYCKWIECMAQPSSDISTNTYLHTGNITFIPKEIFKMNAKVQRVRYTLCSRTGSCGLDQNKTTMYRAAIHVPTYELCL